MKRYERYGREYKAVLLDTSNMWVIHNAIGKRRAWRYWPSGKEPARLKIGDQVATAGDYLVQNAAGQWKVFSDTEFAESFKPAKADSTFTCALCRSAETCIYAFDDYCKGGDCLLEK